MVTNPATRDPSVTASTFATLNDMFGNRTICGIGRGGSALKVIGGKPVRLGAVEEAMHVIKELAEGREVDYDGKKVRIPWVKDGRLDVWMAGYGPNALNTIGRKADGFILQLADPEILEWSLGYVREGAVEAGRNPKDVKVCVAAAAYVGDDLAHQREQCRWFGSMVSNSVVKLVARYGRSRAPVKKSILGRIAVPKYRVGHQFCPLLGPDCRGLRRCFLLLDRLSSRIPTILTDYVKDRKGYDYSKHGKPDNPTTKFVPDHIVERFCVLGPAEEHVSKLQVLRDVGADQFNIYLMHDAMEETLQTYGQEIIPAL